MRTLLLRLFPTRPDPSTSSRPAGGSYRGTGYLPLRPWQVRGRRFAVTRLFRRGLDPAEVDEFLGRVADDLHQVYAELARSRDENVRIKNTLRQWQSNQAPTMRELARLR